MPSSISSLGSGELNPRWLGPVLFGGLLAGPLGWLISLEAAYVASYSVCDETTRTVLHAALLAPLLIILAGVFVIVRAKQHKTFADAGTWARSVASAGLWLCLWFAVVVLVTELPVLSLVPCR